ncbi:MAG: hypothetical protein GX963_03035 [Bacteroidales bacterium]|nr:hypothetical protein [Bacteroidales bacterium]
MALEKEIWVSQIQENFYPDSSFLKYGQDYSGLVENNAINMAEAGVDPKVLINNTTYPITVAKRVDTPIRIELDKFETENTLVRRPEEIQYAYSQLESVLMGHRNQLRAKTAEKAAHAYAPQEDSPYTPVILTTGTAKGTRKTITFDDILNLKERFDNMEIPLEQRFLVLHPSHVTDLIRLDVKGFKDITDLVNGQPKRFAGFGVLQFSRTPFYELDTMEKLEWSVKVGENSGFCSFAFQANEIMKADGDVFLYSTENDPKERATIVGFDKRFIAVPIRNKGIGAIVSAKA